MPKMSKRHRSNRETMPTAPLPASDAVAALKKFKGTKFDQTVSACVHLGIDPKQADQAIRGSIALPRGIGKSARVICFCAPDKAEAAKAAGAIEAGADDLVEKINGGWFDFDVAIASPDMMRVVSRLGKVLGPKGLMPSPKAGTVTPDIAAAVTEFVAGKQEYRNDEGGNVRCSLGKLSFPEDHLLENFQAFLALIDRVKPAAAKGQYIKNCVIGATMSPAIQVAV